LQFLKEVITTGKTENVARSLLGQYLCRKIGDDLVKGMIVETEAYLSKNDQAFAIDRSLDGHMLWQEPLYLEENSSINEKIQVKATPRIGISVATDKKLRYIISGSNYLSRRESLE